MKKLMLNRVSPIARMW